MKKIFILCVAVLMLSSCNYYRDHFDFVCVASYSDNTDGGVIYKLEDKSYPTQYCYATPSTNIVLAGKYSDMVFCYAEDSTVVLCAKSGHKIEWYDLKGKLLKCNYTYASNKEYEELYAKNPSLKYENDDLVWDSSILFPDRISAEELKNVSAKGVVLPKQGDVYTCLSSGLDSATLKKLGFISALWHYGWPGFPFIAALIAYIILCCSPRFYGNLDAGSAFSLFMILYVLFFCLETVLLEALDILQL